MLLQYIIETLAQNGGEHLVRVQNSCAGLFIFKAYPLFWLLLGFTCLLEHLIGFGFLLSPCQRYVLAYLFTDVGVKLLFGITNCHLFF